jgi:hypothetical protein
MGKSQTGKERLPCSFCKKKGKEVIHNQEITEPGTHIGNGGILGANIMEYRYKMPGKTAQDHPLSIPTSKRPKYCVAQAHHLICSETMRKGRDWPKICKNYGYDINHSKNGIFLPSDMRIACHEEIPLHKGGHSATVTEEEGINYVNRVKQMVEPIKAKAKKEKYCDPKNGNIIEDLNDVSCDIRYFCLEFVWTLTDGGHDFMPGGPGCRNEKTIPKKRETSATKCNSNRDHNLKVIGRYFIES